MKIFIICCLLFIHVNMYIFIRGFRVSIRVSGIRGFGFGDGFPPESVSGSGSGFDFGCTETPPDPNPTRCHLYHGLTHLHDSLREKLNFPMWDPCKANPSSLPM